MKNYMLQELKDAEKNNIIVSLFDNKNNPDSWNTGLIDVMTENEIIIKSISREGRYDGYIVRNVADIFRLDVNGIYEKRIFKQYNILKQTHKSFLKGKINKEDNLFLEALKASKAENYVVGICIVDSENEETIEGFVKEINDDIVVVSKISYDGFYDGESIIYLNDIVYLDCDTSIEATYKLLWDNKIQL